MLDLNDLGTGQNPGITAAIGNAMAEAGAVCLQWHNHWQGVHLIALTTLGPGTSEKAYSLAWAPIGSQARRGWNDMREATEDGAAGIAVLLANQEIGYMVIARSWKGTGFDYLLGDTDVLNISDAERSVTSDWAKVLEDDSLVARCRMEVSGLLEGGDSAVAARVNAKLEQTDRSDTWAIPAFVIVVEFGRPLAEVRKK